MTISDLYQREQDCCGCELCSMVCSKQIIEMLEDDEGFLYPHIQNESSCINCKRCITICPEKSPGRAPGISQSSYGGYVNDTQAVKSCSSGGFATAISTVFIQEGGVVYGVKYSENYRAIEFGKAETVEELASFRTSKYAQAHKSTVYRDVQEDLKTGRRVLFIGLPCEVSALYHYVRNVDNLYSVSLICHGPTSQMAHRQFCDMMQAETGGDELSEFSMRYKKTGWKPYYLKAVFKNGAVYLKVFNKTEYEVAFKYMKRPSCSTCQYKLGNEQFGLAADLVLGDFHAVRKNSPEYNSWGVSQATILTGKGEELMTMLNGQATIVPISQGIITSTNIALRAPVPVKKYRNHFISVFRKKGLKAASKHPLIQFEIRKDKIIKQTKVFLVKVRNMVLH